VEGFHVGRPDYYSRQSANWHPSFLDLPR
jgi:hypothetical protein